MAAAAEAFDETSWKLTDVVVEELVQDLDVVEEAVAVAAVACSVVAWAVVAVEPAAGHAQVEVEQSVPFAAAIAENGALKMA